jgi:translation initiation factor 5A
MDISDDGFVSLLDEEKNETRDDIKLPSGDLGNDIKERFEKEETIKVTVLKSMGEEAILSFKVENDSKK